MDNSTNKGIVGNCRNKDICGKNYSEVNSFEIMALQSPAHEPIKKLDSKSFPRRFQCPLSSATITRSGATPASAVTSPSRMLTRPVHGLITRHSAIQVDSQECLQPPDPASHHIAARNEISSQLVWSTPESLATVSVIVAIRVAIAVQPNLANGSHIARSHTL